MPHVSPLSALQLADPLLDWYARAARDLPWRRPDASPWAVLVSEIMLQQTPVARVLPVYAAWLARWPAPADLAGAAPGDAVRMWGRLGYPRRALRLHECAVRVRDEYGGELPRDVEALLALPGVGEYTARAVAAFAFGDRVPVVDTNVRRVVARVVDGAGRAGLPAVRRDLAAVESLLPTDRRRAARFSVALMELGALVCTARQPQCAQCPLVDRCAWVRAGSPDYTGPTARAQRFTGTDREVRGRLMAVLRESAGPVPKSALDVVWHDAVQRERALDSLAVDGLVDPRPDGTFALPGQR
jgi:A/G-specific adenine glycosylase